VRGQLFVGYPSSPQSLELGGPSWGTLVGLRVFLEISGLLLRKIPKIRGAFGTFFAVCSFVVYFAQRNTCNKITHLYSLVLIYVD